MYEIHADEVVLGKNVVIEDGVILRGRSAKNAKRIVIGDNSFIGENCRTYVDHLEIGDYTSIHNHTLISGDLPCSIGHCSWVGQNSVLNSTGGLTIGNGVGIGAYSQLWSHIRHGDMLQGCRWNETRPLIIEDDVWFVGHCIVSPVHAGARSMAMVGSVVTQAMLPDRTYAGVPAKDVTEKLGPQFSGVDVAVKYGQLKTAYAEFCVAHPQYPVEGIRLLAPGSANPLIQDAGTWFDVSTRRYRKRGTDQEFAFMKFLLARLYRFFPAN